MCLSFFYPPHPYSFEYNHPLSHYLYRINLFYDLMKNFLKQVRVLAQFIIGFSLGYFAFTLFPFPSLPSIIMLMVAIFVLLKAAGNFDEINGLGPTNNPSPQQQPKPHQRHNIDINDQCDFNPHNDSNDNDCDCDCNCNNDNRPPQHEQF